MLPIGDDLDSSGTPWITVVAITACVVIWSLIQGFGTEPALQESVCEFAFVPSELRNVASTRLQHECLAPRAGVLTTVALSTFMHGSWLHLLGNLWFLGVFGRRVEQRMGHVSFFLLFVVSAVLATGCHAASSLSSQIPLLGASGAIGGVMAAYLVLFGRAQVKLLIFLVFIIQTIEVPAFLMLGYWLLLQLGGATVKMHGGGQSVAYFAHIGGFAAGAALAAAHAKWRA